ncbi:MAG: hypothetical protein HYS27_08545 [Deltaproteobacteria bacterium]|nr:hypothetical protein [Deltaproteobacteria bacterium]
MGSWPPRHCTVRLGVRRATAALSLALAALMGACPKETAVDVYVDGFEPENVRFEVEELGARSHTELTELARRGDIDGLVLLPAGACGGSCRAAIVSIFVHNRGGAEAPPVVRLKSPEGKAARQPIAFRGDEITHGRVGRIRWIVELWPGEQRLTATLSSSVRLVDLPPTQPPTLDGPAAPLPTPTPDSPAAPPPAPLPSKESRAP